MILTKHTTTLFVAMNRFQALSPNRTDMNIAYPHALFRSSERIAAVRAEIEQEFLPLHRQQPRVLQLVLNEAEALAWQSGFPHLLFPLLAREKALALAEWQARQQAISKTEPIRAFAM
jgi:hypothetical protein